MNKSAASAAFIATIAIFFVVSLVFFVMSRHNGRSPVYSRNFVVCTCEQHEKAVKFVSDFVMANPLPVSNKFKSHDAMVALMRDAILLHCPERTIRTNSFGIPSDSARLAPCELLFDPKNW